MARLYEYEGKRLLKHSEVPVPLGEVAESPEEVKKIASGIGKSVVIKSQIWSTGRLKAGGIKFADNPDEAKKAADDLLGSSVKGHKVSKVLVEEKLDIDKEMYGSIIVDDSYKIKGPKALLCSEGGVDIEEIAKESPEKLAQMSIDFEKGIRSYNVHNLALDIGLEGEIIRPLGKIMTGLYKVFREYDARSAEINPLVLTKDGKLYACDCRIVVDDASAYRHPEFDFGVPRDMPREPTELEKVAWGIEETDYRGVAYFTQITPEPPEDKGKGYIAFHAIGGGGAMKAADVLSKHNFKLADYTDTSGNPTASKVYRVAKVALTQPGIEGYIVLAPTIANQNQWHHAHGLVKAFREELQDKKNFPVIILICGNKEKESQDILKRGLSDLPIYFEVYGRDHFHKLDYLCDQMAKAVASYRKQKGVSTDA